MVILAFYNLYIAPSLQTESKYSSKLALIAIPYFLDIIASFIFSMSGKIAWEVYLFFLIAVIIACLMSASTKNTFSISAVVFFRMSLRSFSMFFLKDAL